MSWDGLQNLLWSNRENDRVDWASVLPPHEDRCDYIVPDLGRCQLKSGHDNSHMCVMIVRAADGEKTGRIETEEWESGKVEWGNGNGD